MQSSIQLCEPPSRNSIAIIIIIIYELLSCTSPQDKFSTYHFLQFLIS